MITYESATPEDAEQIFGLCRQLVDAYEDIGSIDYDRVMQWIRRKIESDIARYTAVFLSGEKVGYFHFCKNEDGEYELDDLYIFPEYQNRGIGTRIVQRCCASVSEPVMLYVFRRNQGAVALYRRLGFEILQTVYGSRYIMKYTRR